MNEILLLGVVVVILSLFVVVALKLYIVGMVESRYLTPWV
jgi:hypothetical protein